MKRFLLSTFALVALPALLGILVNALRVNGIPLIAEHPYEILLPCPMEQVEVESVSVADVLHGQVLFIDARPQDSYEKSHIPGAISLPYDDLAEPSAADLQPVRNARAERIVVYGELDQSFDIGHQQASDLAAAGLPRVFYLAGGFGAWLEAGRPVDPPKNVDAAFDKPSDAAIPDSLQLENKGNFPSEVTK